MKAIFNNYFSFESVTQILVFSLCAVFLVQRLGSISRTACEMRRRLCSTSPTCTHWQVSSQTRCVTPVRHPSLGTWASLQPSPAVPRQQPCKGSQDLGEQNRHMCTGCPAPELSCSLLSGNQGFKSGSNFCWHSFMKSWWCKFLLCVTILSVQMVCRITKLAAVNRTKFALHWSSKECAGRPDVGPPVCSVLFGILVTLLPAGWPEGLGPYRQVKQSKKK